jgi:CBS domain-containing protein
MLSRSKKFTTCEGSRAERGPYLGHGLRPSATFAKDWQPPFGIFGRLLTDPDGRVDLKQNGLLPIVTAARTLALKHGIRPTSTVTRLTELKARSLADADTINKAISAFTDIVRAVLAQQVKDSDHGISLSARVDVAAMGTEQKEGVTKSMRAINELIKATLQT